MKGFAKKLLILTLLMLIAIACTAQAERKTLKLPENLQIIHRSAFQGDASLDRVVLPEGIKLIMPEAFKNSSIREIYLPESLVSIGPDAFDGCDNLTAIVPRGSVAHQFFSDFDLPYIIDEPKQSEEDLESAKYIIHRVALSGENAAAADAFSAIADTAEECVLKIALYDEDNENGEALLTLEIEAPAAMDEGELLLSIPQDQPFPAYYVLKAALFRVRDGKQMGETYISREHTRLYAQMQDRTEDDYAGSRIISYGDAGYAVLADHVLIIDGSFLSSSSFTFTPPRPLHRDDVLMLTLFGKKHPVKVSSVQEHSDGTVTVTPDRNVTFSDVFEYLKISGYMQQSDSGFVSSGAPAGEAAIIPFSPSLSYGPVSVDGEASASIMLDLVFDRKDDYFSFEFWIANEGTLNVTFSEGFSTKDLDYNPLQIPLYNAPLKIPGTDIGASLEISIPLDVDLDAGGTAEITYENKTGFSYNSIDDQMIKISEKDSSAYAKVKGDVTVAAGPQILLKAELMDMLEAKIRGQVGVEVDGSLTGLEYGGSISNTTEDSMHACGGCLDCDISIIAGVWGTLDVNISEKISFSALDSELLVLRKQVGDAYWSFLNDKESIYGGAESFALTECKNNKYRTTVYTHDMNHNELKGISTTIMGDTINAMTSRSPAYAYLYPGAYNASATINGTAWNTDFTVKDKPEHIVVQEVETVVRGRVISSRGEAPLAGASVTLTLPSGKQQTTTTDENGEYAFKKLSGGTYTITFSADNHETYTTPKQTIPAGAVWPFNVMLYADTLVPIQARLSSYPSGSFSPATATDMSGKAIAEKIILTPTKTFGHGNRAMSEMKLENQTTGASYTLSIPEADFCMTAQLYGGDMGDGVYTYAITTYTDASRNRCVVLREEAGSISKVMDFSYLGQTDSVYGADLDREGYVDYNNAQPSDSAYGIFRSSGSMMRQDDGTCTLVITVDEGHYQNGWTLGERFFTYYRLVSGKLIIVDQFYR